MSYSNPTILYCGGSIISENFILTSGDCVNTAKSIKIGMGSPLLAQPTKWLLSTTYFVHPQFNRSYYQNNIGLVQLPTPLVWTQTLSAIRLVSRSQSSQTFTGVETFFTGFGRTDESKDLNFKYKWIAIEFEFFSPVRRCKCNDGSTKVGSTTCNKQPRLCGELSSAHDYGEQRLFAWIRESIWSIVLWRRRRCFGY